MVMGMNTTPSPHGTSEDPMSSSFTTPAQPGTAPALNPVRWSGKKTAIAAALALGLGGVTAGTAAAVSPASESSGQHMPGGGPGGPGGAGGTTPGGAPGGVSSQGAAGSGGPSGPGAPPSGR